MKKMYVLLVLAWVWHTIQHVDYDNMDILIEWGA